MSIDRAQVLDEIGVLPEGVVTVRGATLAALARIVRTYVDELDHTRNVSNALLTLAIELDAGAQRARRVAELLSTSAHGTAEEVPSTDLTPSTHDIDSGHLSTDRAAERLGVSDRWVRGLCQRGELPGARQDARGTWSIPEDDVITYAHERQQRKRHDAIG